MFLMVLSLGVMVVGGLSALFLRTNFRLSAWLGAAGVVIGSILGLIPAVQVLLQGSAMSFSVPWGLPFGKLILRLDALAAWFLIPIFLVSSLAAVYGVEYMSEWRGRRETGPSWLFYNALVGSMSLVVLAGDGVLFLIAWELMSLSSFFLVTFEHEKKNVRDAGWIYLVATHFGTACLMGLFVVMAGGAGSFDFSLWSVENCQSAAGVILFVTAMIGFGAKAGLMPLHIWLPEAHPAAPSHVSAVMSGVMIKTGIYGLLRFVSFLKEPPPGWWGWSIIGIGAFTGIAGILFALTQRDVKKFLAYSSVENVGVIMLGLGAGVLGLSVNSPALSVLGFSGGLIHVLNHAFFKGLLFLGAGSVLHGAKILDMDQLGGLLKRMPWTGVSFLIGAAAISALPPFNGFISEYLIFMSAAKGVAVLEGNARILPIVIITALALIGGVALAAFSRAFGVIFLGEARRPQEILPHECGWAMRWPMMILAAGCFGLGIGAPVVFAATPRLLASIGALPPDLGTAALGETALALKSAVLVFSGLLTLVFLIAMLRRRLLQGRTVQTGVTWDCGFLKPTSRMQYSASSFSQPLASLFQIVLRTRKKTALPKGFFPGAATFNSANLDFLTESVFRPLYHVLRSGLSKLRWIQHGRINAYILYIGLTLLILLVWNLR